MMLISVVIPVYNTKDYLRQCVESVLESDTFDVDGQNILVRGGHIVGHRGDMGFATTSKDSLPENSVEALISAAQSGVSSVEFDVYMTLDGYLVLNHNTSIKGFFVYEDDCPLTPEQRKYFVERNITIL